MAKNNKKKSKSMQRQKKSVAKDTVEGKAAEAEAAQATAADVVEAKAVKPRVEENEKLALAEKLTAVTLDVKEWSAKKTDDSMHFDDMSTIATMSLLIHQQIQHIRVVRKQMFELHTQQDVLLQALTIHLEKLRTAEHTTVADGQIIAKTFETVNAQLVDIFSGCLPKLSLVE
ncbi:uncharacterized protein LOC117585905 [Drosophila guanche]|uniref:Uncharacterized protein n=1 Tax=Drosophila guanche TaxID=7266 RepID=A0A3B0JPY0_DROGU|nr:uncharacterized protein LOC117585905 [Drosophila guanche]SPP84267.1 Hypothetical predicted protein [Drosophila guanche]